MATLREIRRRIASVRSTQQITKAMKMVAAARLRKAQDKALSMRPYAQKLYEIVGHLVAHIEENSEPLLKIKPVERILVVVVTADRGLCGGFNSNIIRESVRNIQSMHDKEVQVFSIGKKCTEYFSKRDFILFSNKNNFFNHLEYEIATELTGKLVEAYTQDQFDRIDIYYNKFKSAVAQELTCEQFLPFVPDAGTIEEKSSVDFLYQPSKEEILSAIIPRQLNIQLWKILLESYAAEQAARMTAMENATENAEELITKLTMTYNRARQAAITKEISEIVGGAEALKEK
jgi:F-type H+-transporting ATPase subunit gamma